MLLLLAPIALILRAAIAWRHPEPQPEPEPLEHDLATDIDWCATYWVTPAALINYYQWWMGAYGSTAPLPEPELP